MKALTSTAVVLTLLLAPLLPCAADDVVPATQLASIAILDDIVDTPESLSGMISNHGDKRIENVRLLVSYGWLWNDDRRSDDASPGWTEIHTLPLAVEAGQRVPFTLHHERPRPARDDGQLTTTVKVIGLTQWHFTNE